MTLVQDLRDAARALAKHPGYVATALLTLALGIGFSTATFTVVNAVLLKPLPYRDPSRLVFLRERSLPRFPEFSVSPGHYLFWRDHATAFEGIGGYRYNNATVEIAGQEPEQMRADRVTANLFPVLGVAPVIGRGFTVDDDRDGAPPVVLLSYPTWRDRFGGDPAAIGRTIRLDRRPAAIIGVMPSDFMPPGRQGDVWIPMAFTAAEHTRYGSHYMSAIGRLKPGVTLDAANRDMQRVARLLIDTADPGSKGWDVLLFNLRDFTVRNVQTLLYVLLGAVALVLLIACVNVANLLLVRGTARQRELAIRAAIGASRWRLLRQLIVEQVVLASIAAVAGVIFAAWLLNALLTMMPDALPRQATIGIDGQVLAFALALTMLTPIVFGLVPALQTSRPDVRSLLAAGGRQGSGAPGARLRDALVAIEIAFAMMLLVGTALLVRSFANLLDESPGFRPDHTVVARVDLPPDQYPLGARRAQFFDTLLERITAMPQVEAAGLAMPMPLVDNFNSGFQIEGEQQPGDQQPPLTLFYAVSAGYFAAIGTPLLRGRLISDTDALGAPRVVVINQTLADSGFKGTDPIGRRIGVGQGDNAWREIVGIVADAKQFGLADHPRAQVYESFRQHPYFSGFSVIVRTNAADPASIVPGVRGILRGMDRAVPLADVRTLDDMLAATVRPQRFSAVLITLFGAAALLLATIGVYGVISYTVGTRTQEFGIRIAHGADRRAILSLVLRGAMGITAAGVGLGLAGAWLLRHAVASLLFGVTATDGVTYGLVAATLSFVAIVASLVPALRATRINPLDALRA